MRYSISLNGETKGPYTIGQLRAMWNAGTITGETFYCVEGSNQWFHLKALATQLESWSAAPPQPRVSAQPRTIFVKSAKSRGTYIILGLFLGCLGIHNFYAGYHGKGAAQLIITLVFGWLVIGIIITWIWALIEVCTVTHDANGDKMT
jgi:TM2 domain-containing membrane protein YozV